MSEDIRSRDKSEDRSEDRSEDVFRQISECLLREHPCVFCDDWSYISFHISRMLSIYLFSPFLVISIIVINFVTIDISRSVPNEI